MLLFYNFQQINLLPKNENIDIVLIHPTNVTVAGGTPRLILDIGGATAYADLSSGSGTNILNF